MASWSAATASSCSWWAAATSVPTASASKSGVWAATTRTASPPCRQRRRRTPRRPYRRMRRRRRRPHRWSCTCRASSAPPAHRSLFHRTVNSIQKQFNCRFNSLLPPSSLPPSFPPPPKTPTKTPTTKFNSRVFPAATARWAPMRQFNPPPLDGDEAAVPPAAARWR